MTKKLTVLFGFTLLLSTMFATSFACDACDFTLPDSIIRKLAKRRSRLHHYVWHVTRDNWNLLTPDQQQELKEIGWEVERPSLNYDAQRNPIPITDNNSGRDFLYMHQQMINNLNDMLLKEGLPKLRGWKKLPAPGDKNFPLPPFYEIPGDTTGFAGFLGWTRSDDIYYGVLKPLEDQFTSYDALRKMSLGEMGSLLETGLHMFMHFRFSEASTLGYRGLITPENMLNPIDKKWDDVEYNWMGDFYSAHCHRNFWLLHYWVNERIEDWRKANGLKAIDWTGAWSGGPLGCIFPMVSGKKADSTNLRANKPNDSDDSDDDNETLEKVVGIFGKAGLDANKFKFDVENKVNGKKVDWKKNSGSWKGKGN